MAVQIPAVLSGGSKEARINPFYARGMKSSAYTRRYEQGDATL
jgi:hypothetical protein